MNKQTIKRGCWQESLHVVRASNITKGVFKLELLGNQSKEGTMPGYKVHVRKKNAQ